MKPDQNLIAEVLERGVEKIYPDKDFLLKILSSDKQLTFYAGFDPSAPSLHIGNAIQLAKLSQLQRLGHKIIFLVGDFTGMIGDPTDKKSVRKQLDRETVKANAKLWKKQASAWLSFSGSNAARLVYNSQWYDKMSLEEFMRLAAGATVQQMIVRDMFQARLKEEKPIYLHEFLYPLIQGYDSVALGVDGEVGGNDQTFNMLMGRDFLKASLGKEKIVIANKLLTDAEGKKMGKSEGNIVNLNETPENMYGQIMSWPDNIISSAFELCTKLPWEEVKEIQKRLKTTGLNPRDFKMKLAREITEIYYGKKRAEAAEQYFVKTVQNKEIPEEMEEIKVKSENLLEMLLETKLASSKGEARRLLEQGGVKLDGQSVSDGDLCPKLPVVLQKGKREFRRLLKA